MICTIVHIWVKPEFKADFIQASTINQNASIKEEGNLRFDFLQDDTKANKFVLYEAYATEAAAAAHKNTSHYSVWRDTVADMMAQPRLGEKHTILAL